MHYINNGQILCLLDKILYNAIDRKSQFLGHDLLRVLREGIRKTVKSEHPDFEYFLKPKK